MSERKNNLAGAGPATGERLLGKPLSSLDEITHTHTSTHTYTRKKMSESQPDAQLAGRGCSKLPNCENSAAVQPVARSRDLSAVLRRGARRARGPIATWKSRRSARRASP